MYRYVFISIILFLPASSYSWEVDNISCRFIDLKDSSKLLDDYTNNLLDKVVESQGPTTKKNPDKCDYQILHVAYNILAQPWSNNLETWAENSNLIDRCKLPHNASVYQKFSTLERGVAVLGLHSIISVDGYKFGTDKLSHFMTEGYAHYKQYGKGGDPRTVARVGQPQEKYGYGLTSTGIYSYADLYANYKGLQFWKNLIDGNNPYLKCKKGQWVRDRVFKWREFIDFGFDESINCNSYRTENMQKKVDDSTEEIAIREKHLGLKTCPLNSRSCSQLVKKIRDENLRNMIVHPKCISIGLESEESSKAEFNEYHEEKLTQ